MTDARASAPPAPHRPMLRWVTRPLLILLALIFLFEAWLWEHLKPIVGWLVAWIPWQNLKARVAAAIERLPPYATLLVFLVPITLLLPVKFLGLWLLARGLWLGAMATLLLAKVVSMGIMAFIFELTRPKLLQIGWFRWLYEHVMVWLAWAHGLADPFKRRIKRLLRLLSPRRSGRALRLLRRIRRRMHAPA
jgi:hypothetical protein